MCFCININLLIEGYVDSCSGIKVKSRQIKLDIYETSKSNQSLHYLYTIVTMIFKGLL